MYKYPASRIEDITSCALTSAVALFLMIVLVGSGYAAAYPTSVSLADKSEVNGEVVQFGLDTLEYGIIVNARNLSVIDFPLAPGKNVDMELEQFAVHDKESNFVVKSDAGDSAWRLPEVTFFRGKVVSEDESTVFLSLSPHGINGFVDIGESTYYVSPNRDPVAANGGLQAWVTSEKNVQVARSHHSGCGVPDTDGERWDKSHMEGRILGDYPYETTYLIDLAFACDNAYYNLMGQDVSRSFVYMLQLAAASSVIYERDFDAKLWVRYAELWTGPDPYADGSDSVALYDFREYWNTYRDNVNRDIACKLSVDNVGYGFVDELCQRDWAYAACGINEGSFPNPIDPHDNWWDLQVVAHELGHVFGTRHTHCYSPPLDSCYTEEDGCYNGSRHCRLGTIMSYCHECGHLGG